MVKQVVLNANSDEGLAQIPYMECREAVMNFLKPMTKETSYVDFLSQENDAYNADNEESGAEGDERSAAIVCFAAHIVFL